MKFFVSLFFLLASFSMSSSLIAHGGGRVEHLDDDDDDHDHDNVVHLTPEQIASAHIETAIASPKNLQVTLSIPAKITVNEDRHFHVVPKAPGIVSKIFKSLGDNVKAGEPLAIIESREIATAKGEYLTNLKKQALAMQILAGEEVLKNKKISSEQDYLEAQADAKEAEIDLEVAVQHLYILGMDEEEINQLPNKGLQGLRNFEIKAPIDGVVIGRDLNLGELVSAEDEIFTIADLNSVWVEMGVYPRDLSAVRPGKKIQVTPLKGETPSSEAVITWVSPIINEDTKSASATATLPNHARKWFPGTNVCACVVSDEIYVPIAVKKDAVHEIDDEMCIFVIHPEGFEKTVVTTGKCDANFVEILSGIDPGTTYAATNTFLLKAEHGKGDGDDHHH